MSSPCHISTGCLVSWMFVAGHHLAPDNAVGTVTFDQFLAAGARA